MTPEEKAVIEAAEGLVDYGIVGGKPGTALWESVAALRESRKPKPRWSALGAVLADHTYNHAYTVRPVGDGDQGLAVRIADALNRAEP